MVNQEPRTKNQELKDKAQNRFFCIVGPTASGKTHSYAACRSVNGEIVSADSRQVYRHLDIGTAKPTPEDLRNVRHHFVDILDPTEDTMQDLQRSARRCVENFLKKAFSPSLSGTDCMCRE